MRHIKLATLIPLAVAIALGPVHGALAASPTVQSQPTAEASHWLAATSAHKIMRNGVSVNGVQINGVPTHGTSSSGRRPGNGGGMSVVSIQLPGAARHAK